MSRDDDQPLSVAELLEMVPAEDSWVNAGFVAVVRSIKQSPADARKKFWKCSLGDHGSNATISMSLFFAPKFREADFIEVTGQGIKRKEFNGEPQVSIGQKTEIHVRDRPPQTRQPELKPTPERPPAAAPASAPTPTNGDTPQVAEEIASQAVSDALALHSHGLEGEDLRTRMNGAPFWAHVHITASDITRVVLLIKKGKLAPAVKERISA